MAKKVVVCIAKNEALDLAEWMAFYFSMGFDAIVVYDNNSSDGTRDVVRNFMRHFDVRLRPWHRSDKFYQIGAYQHAIDHNNGEFDWALFVDVDEFVIGFQGDFIEGFHQTVSQVHLNWAIFGSSGHKLRPQGLVIENYCYRVPDEHGGNRHTKSFVRLSHAMQCANPHYFRVTGRSVNIVGDPMVWSENPGPGVATHQRLDGPRINHYWIKSAADWRRKCERGYPEGVIRTEKQRLDLDAESTVYDNSAFVYVEATRHILHLVS